MKVFIFLIIIAAFLQSSFIPINLVLILLISRSLVTPEKQNLYVAFLAGILVGLLQSQNIGFWAVVFLAVVRLVHLTKKLPFSKNIFTVLAVNILMLSVTSILVSFFLHQSFEQNKLIVEVILSLPIYLLILFWEERFMVKSDNRLKLRN